MLMKYKILIFDLDDTLIDDKESVRAGYRKMIESAGLVYSDLEFKRWFNIDIQFWCDWQDGKIELPKELKNETGIKSDKFLDWLRSQRFLIYFDQKISLKQAIKLNNIYMEALGENIVAINGAYDTLKYLSGKYKILVATNGPKVATKQKLEKIGCLSFVTDVLSADMFGYMKPSIKFFEAIEKQYADFKRSDYLIIGNSLKSDVGFGMNAGIDSCWFNNIHDKFDFKYSSTIVINELSELMGLL